MLSVLLLPGLFLLASAGFYEESARRYVESINKEGGIWTAGYNEYLKGKSQAQLKQLCGVLPGSSGHIAPVKTYPEDSINSLPKSYIVGKDKWHKCASTVNFIKDQSQCGSCWAIAASEVIADRMCIVDYFQIPDSDANLKEKAPWMDMSVEEINACCTDCGSGCGGGWPIKAMNYWQTQGVVTGGWYGSKCGCQPYTISPKAHRASTPHCYHSCENYYKTPFKKDKHFATSHYFIHRNESSIMQEIYEHGPVECAFDIYANFYHYKSGIYDRTQGTFYGGHAVKVIGWGEDNGTPYWLINNSWNVTWGMNGQFKFKRGINLANMEKYCVGGIPKAYGEGMPLLKCPC